MHTVLVNIADGRARDQRRPRCCRGLTMVCRMWYGAPDRRVLWLAGSMACRAKISC